MGESSFWRIAAVLLAAVLLIPLVPAALSDADGDAQEPDATYYRYTIKFINTSTDSLYQRWDFGDGTVLDSRWEAYRDAYNDGLLEGDALEGFEAYLEVLEDNGGSRYNPIHTFGEVGVYEVSLESYNPRGYINPDSETPLAYDGFYNSDDAGYDGGLMSGSEDASVRGSYDRYTRLVAVMGHPTITLDTGDGPEMEPIVVENGASYLPALRPDDPVWEGHTFLGWYSDEGMTQEYDWMQDVTVPITLYAKWQGPAEYDHVITFKDGDLTVGEQSVTDHNPGATEVALQPPTGLAKAYHVLQGWSIGGHVYSAGETVQVPVEGLVLQAYWAEKTLMVQPVSAVSAVAGSEARFSVSVSSDPAGAEVIVAVKGPLPQGMSVRVIGNEVVFTSQSAGTFTLTVAASADDYRASEISVRVNVEPRSVDHTIIYKDGLSELGRQSIVGTNPGEAEMALRAPENVSKEGYVLLGWRDPAGGLHREGDVLAVPESGTVLSAVWVPDHAAVSVADVSVSAGGTRTVPVAFDPDVVPAGLLTEFWRSFSATASVSPLGGLLASVSGGTLTIYAPNVGTYDVTVTVTGPEGFSPATGSFRVTVSAPVGETEHNVVFFDGDVAKKVQGVSSADESVAVVLAPPVLTKDDKALLGWSADPDAEQADARYAAGKTVQVTGSGLALYAVWGDDEGSGSFDWAPWVLLAIGILLLIAGLWWCPCLWYAIPGLAVIVLAVVDIAGLVDVFGWCGI